MDKYRLSVLDKMQVNDVAKIIPMAKNIIDWLAAICPRQEYYRFFYFF